MHLLRALAALALTAALVAGCGDDESDSPSTEQSTQATTPTDSASPSDDESSDAPTDPVLPDAAKQSTKAGAKAFVRYYWSVIDHATATGRVKGLNELAGPGCDGCRGGAGSIKNVYKQGGTITSSPYTVDRMTLHAFDADGIKAGYTVTVEIVLDGQVIKIPGEKANKVPRLEERYNMVVVFIDGNWRVDDLESVK